MGTDTFRRHTRACVDSATHLAFASFPSSSSTRSLFERLLHVVWARSDLMRNAPTQLGDLLQVDALRNLADFDRDLVREPESWPGASGHLLRVVDSLASHLFGRYPTPTFLASAWFTKGVTAPVARGRWFVDHARGQRFRSLPLPFSMTRRMEDLFLRTPHHFTVDRALRRAEILAVGGTPELANVLLSTRLAEHFDDADRWRDALGWLARCGDTIDLVQVPAIVDYLHANLHAIDLRGRTFASVMRLVIDWHGWLAHERSPFLRWRRSPWNELVLPIERELDDDRDAEWAIVELLDSRELAAEGRRMRHCVSSYAKRCASGASSIWSLRRRWCDDGTTVSTLTIEVHPDTRSIVQLRTRANGLPSQWQLELVRQWAAREGLFFMRPPRASPFPIAA